jgi:hypothetical protein
MIGPGEGPMAYGIAGAGTKRIPSDGISRERAASATR